MYLILFVDKKFNFLHIYCASFGNLCLSRFFYISLVIFIGLKFFIIFLYYSLAFIQYFMSHLFLILVFHVFSFFHSINLVESISFDLFKKRSFGSLILLSVHLLFYLFVLFYLFYLYHCHISIMWDLFSLLFLTH